MLVHPVNEAESLRAQMLNGTHLRGRVSTDASLVC